MFPFLIFLLLSAALPAEHPLDSIPTAYKGRFRPADTYARLWLHDMYHRQSLSSQDAPTRSALAFLWQLHLQGHEAWDNVPLFWIRSAALKASLGLNLKQERFSYNELKPHLKKESSDEMQNLLAQVEQFEQIEGKKIDAETRYEELYEQLIHSTPKHELAMRLEAQLPFRVRLAQAGRTFLFLPDKMHPGTWVSLKALKLKVFDPRQQRLVPIPNFTPYSDQEFAAIRTAYLEAEKQPSDPLPVERLALALQQAYTPLAGTPYQHAYGKSLAYPTLRQLEAERLYFQKPFIEVCLLLYSCAAVLGLIALWHPSRLTSLSLLGLVAIAFLLHSFILALRCYILMRPPVSNMFETVLYVPWIATLCGLSLRIVKKIDWGLLAASLTSVALLALLKVTQINSSMENVQAVLDSQYWLIIHVLMVVGSYGIFAIAGVLGHCYLIQILFKRQETPQMSLLARYILQSMYLGVALLIPGTILGGVWAAESWGRFWDWDPKESWAFISSCVYLLWIHAYRFRYIQNFGLAMGAVLGLQAIGFTWYGVNYILGTGLHSYGFGSGGELYYTLFLTLDLLFAGLIAMRQVKRAA